MNNNYNGQNNPGFGEQQNPEFGESSDMKQNNNIQQNGTEGQNGYTAPDTERQSGYSAPGTGGDGYYYQTPIDPNTATPPKSGKDHGATAQALGIIGIVASFIFSCLPIIGLILGILALVNGKRAATEEGQNKDAGSTGRICGIIAIVISAIAIVFNIVFYIVTLSGFMDAFWEEYYRQLETISYMAR